MVGYIPTPHIQKCALTWSPCLTLVKIRPGGNVPKMLTVLFFGTFMSGVLLAESSIDFKLRRISECGAKRVLLCPYTILATLHGMPWYRRREVQ